APPVPLSTTPRTSPDSTIVTRASWNVAVGALVAHRLPPRTRRRRGIARERIELALHVVQRQRARARHRLLGVRAPGEERRFQMAGDRGLLATPGDEQEVRANGTVALTRVIRLDRDRVRAAVGAREGRG